MLYRVLLMNNLKNKIMKIGLELHVFEDGKTALNYWNIITGNDVIAEVREGKLYMDVDDEEKEVSLQYFIERAKEIF